MTVFNNASAVTELSNGISIQLAIVREQNSTTLHVSEYNNTLPFGVKLLTEYSNKPWINPELGYYIYITSYLV